MNLSPDHYYKALEITSKTFLDEADCEFKFAIQDGALMLNNDSFDANIEYSFNGNDVHGTLKATDKWKAMDRNKVSRVWFRLDPDGVATSCKIRVEAWL